MFGKKRSVGNVATNDKIDTIIGKDTQLKGDIVTTGILQIQGQVEGNVKSSSEIIIAENAQVKGDLTAVNAVITGTHIGNINLNGRLEIGSSGKVIGDIKVGSLVIEEGGALDGNCEMLVEQQDAKSKNQKTTKAN